MSVGIGLVGLGRWAGVHASAAGRTDAVHIVSCFSRDSDRRRAFAAEFGIARTASSFEALLADPEVEAVVIATPNDLHADMALSAVEAGKPALVDKPVAVDLEQGLQLLRAAPSATTVGVAHHPRRLAGHRATKRWLESGQGGTPRLAHADFSNARGAAMSADSWHRRVSGAEAGVLIQVGIHQVDNVLYLLGPAVGVNARFARRTLGPMADATVTLVEHTTGAISAITSSWTTPSLYRIEIQATGGNMRFRLDHRAWTSPAVDAHGRLVLDRDGEAEQVIDTAPGDPMVEQLEELAGAASRSAPMEVDVAAGLRAMTVVLAAVRSAGDGGSRVDLAAFLAESGATRQEVDLLVGADS